MLLYSRHSFDHLPKYITNKLFMASRSALEVITFGLSSDMFWHILYIIVLSIWTTRLTQGLMYDKPDKWFKVYAAPVAVLRFEIISFVAAHLARLGIDTRNATVDDSGQRVRKEEPVWFHFTALAIVWLNIAISLAFIFLRLYDAGVHQHHQEPAHSIWGPITPSPTPTHTPQLISQS